MELNIFLIAVGVLLFCKIVNGFKLGLVREVISFVSLIFLCIVAVLIGNGLRSYLAEHFLNVALMVFLLVLLGIAHHLLNVVVFPAKLISKLPIVHSVDKLLGAVAGILETVLVVWTIYIFIGVLDMGNIGDTILKCTAENEILTWFYTHNYLVGWVQMLGAEVTEQLHHFL